MGQRRGGRRDLPVTPAEILGADPEEPVERLQERTRHLLRQRIWPALGVLNLALAALVLAALVLAALVLAAARSAVWPLALVLGLGLLVAWHRARRAAG